MKRITLILSLLVWSINGASQIISQFSWDTNPVTQADIGPDAISIGSSATSSVNGVAGTNGLNAGLPKQDLQMVLPNSSIFDVDGIDVQFDYQREESQGDFLKRGASLIIKGCAQLSVSYRVEDGSGGYNTVNSGNVFSIPNDNVFRHYRFYYLPVTGEGVISVDGTIVWTHDGPDNRNMYWTGAGSIIIGNLMDGSGYNRAFFDNFIIGEVIGSALPIELIKFESTLIDARTVGLNWETASETNNDRFEVERSSDGENWQKIGEVQGGGNTTTRQQYHFYDAEALAGISYYRLKQVDFDGHFSHSEIETVQNVEPIAIYPNPTEGPITIYGESINASELAIFNAVGQSMMSKVILNQLSNGQCQLNIEHLPSGYYYVRHKSLVYKVIKK